MTCQLRRTFLSDSTNIRCALKKMLYLRCVFICIQFRYIFWIFCFKQQCHPKKIEMFQEQEWQFIIWAAQGKFRQHLMGKLMYDLSVVRKLPRWQHKHSLLSEKMLYLCCLQEFDSKINTSYVEFCALLSEKNKQTEGWCLKDSMEVATMVREWAF